MTNRVLLVLTTIILFSFGCQAGRISSGEGKNEAVRGVWLTNVDSDVLTSREKIREAVALCKANGINTIFMVTWNKAVTMHPSKVMLEHFGVEQDTLYWGRDPLAEMIEEAHKENIKVFAWFEFGFSTSYNLDGGHIIAKKPEWAALDSDGNLVKKNNFEWMNGFHPDVQKFAIDLVTEVVRNYNVDGIQGDDRLPAMPSESGYDPYTVALYKKQHNGQEPPADYADPAWIEWRCNLLTDFMGRMYKAVKEIKKDVIVSVSPSIHPFAKEEYLQDWTTWVRKGYVELVNPQLYRYNINAYQKLLDDVYSGQIDKKDLHRFYPGILVKLGKYYPSEEFLLQMIEANRKAGLRGEVFFFYEALKRYPGLFKEKIYTDDVEFPDLLHR
ncbi:MAG: family 10 glycosylhydrolase [Ignavibacteriaceae bacterium]|nr:family 10 glycosylhydrolase [Ignavibacteriaceae bacterium]